ncbi:MAG: peptidylprolyl isomerase [Ardenticatenia bacterium]|nr:peptidylprolyl isomerase [Ardenticatenia bacterium]
MSTEQQVVRQGKVVTIDYQLRLDSGEVVDTTEGREPLEYLQGGGEIIPALEEAIEGMAVGDHKQVVLEAQDAFGEYDPRGRLTIPRAQFPPDLELIPNTELYLRDTEGHPIPAYIVSVTEENVVLDLNHPLAGERLTFDVTVQHVRDATPEELAHGHVHSRGTSSHG